jgi:hypothetical protein
VHTNVAAEYLARSFKSGVPFNVTLDAVNVTLVAALTHIKSIRSPAAKPKELLIVTVTAPDVVSMVSNFPKSELVGVSVEAVIERKVCEVFQPPVAPVAPVSPVAP